MKLGMISATDFVPGIPIGYSWRVHGFSISTEKLSFRKILHSAFATPARYIQEIFLRLSILEGQQEGRSPKFVFNPLYDPGELGVALVLSALKGMASYDCVVVFSDCNGIPAGYLLPAPVEMGDGHLLTLLSTVDSALDLALCRLIFKAEARCHVVPHLDLCKAGHNGFIHDRNQRIYRWLTEEAIAVLSQRAPGETQRAPFTAVMTYHAGDVLFFSLAFKRVRTHIGRIAVNQVYRAIIEDNAPELAILPVKAPLVERNETCRSGQSSSGGDYFDSIKGYLTRDSVYYYCHGSRDANISAFHLIDQFAFALGKQCLSEGELLTRNKAVVAKPYQPAAVAGAVQILLHFDGGWPLKVYPRDLQERLVDLLHTKGYKISVLAAKRYESPRYTVSVFETYAQFKSLVQEQHLVVGMDSFPVHYAAHVLGLPALCLFASTKPENANAPLAQNYRMMERGLRCRPCNGFALCPLYGGSSCKNFVSPEEVAEAVDQLLQSAKHQEHAHKANSQAAAETQGFCLPPNPVLADIPVSRRVSLKHLGAKAQLLATINTLIPLSSFMLLCQQVVASLRRDGLLPTYLRVLRYLRRR